MRFARRSAVYLSPGLLSSCVVVAPFAGSVSACVLRAFVLFLNHLSQLEEVALSAHRHLIPSWAKGLPPGIGTASSSQSGSSVHAGPVVRAPATLSSDDALHDGLRGHLPS